MGVPTFVVTHSVPDGWPREDSSITFVDDLDSAVAQAKAAAGDKIVGVATPDLARQLLNAQQLDEINVNLMAAWRCSPTSPPPRSGCTAPRSSRAPV